MGTNLDLRTIVHLVTVLVVFSITGLLITQVSPFILKNIIGLQGGFIDGPWSYRIAYLCIIPPIYYIILLLVGTVFGKGHYFRSRIKKTFIRIFSLRNLTRNKH